MNVIDVYYLHFVYLMVRLGMKAPNPICLLDCQRNSVKNIVHAVLHQVSLEL